MSTDEGFDLGPAARAAGYRVEAFGELGSTSALALERAGAGTADRLWIATAHQTQGHGRRGRAWLTPAGNLAASLLIRSPAGIATGASLGFVAGLALDHALAGLLPGARIGVALDAANPAPGSGSRERLALKWPNDVMASGAKLAGILIETVATREGTAFVVGMGVNVTVAPDALPYPVTSLRDLGCAMGAGEVFRALAETWPYYFDLWNHGAGLPAIRDLWLERASGIGAPVAVRAANGQIVRGHFETIDDEGHLVVRAQDGSAHVIAAGEVHFGAAASVAAGTAAV